MSALSIKATASNLIEKFYLLPPPIQHRMAGFYRQQLRLIDYDADVNQIIEPMPYKFWMVFNATTMAAPTVMHEKEKLAQSEAERLAQKQPGHRFVVLESMYEMTTRITPVAKTVHKKLPK